MSKLSSHDLPSTNINFSGSRLFAICKSKLFLSGNISLSHPLSRNKISSSHRYRACVPITHQKVIWSGSNDLDRQWPKNNGKSASPMVPARKATNDSKLAWRAEALALFSKLALHELLSADVSIFRCRRFAIGKPNSLPHQVWPKETSPFPQHGARDSRSRTDCIERSWRYLTNNNEKVT